MLIDNVDSDYSILYDTSEIANGRLVKAMPNFAAYSYLIKDMYTTLNVYHPYSVSSERPAALYNSYSSTYNPRNNTTGVEYFYVYTTSTKLPNLFMPDPSTTVLTAEE
jgi:hypothetical protein